MHYVASCYDSGNCAPPSLYRDKLWMRERHSELCTSVRQSVSFIHRHPLLRIEVINYTYHTGQSGLLVTR